MLLQNFIFYIFLLKESTLLQIFHLSKLLSKFIFPFTTAKREKDIVGSERLAHGYSIAWYRSPIYSLSTFVLVKTVLALFYLSFLSPGSRRYFCFTTQFYEGIYAISNTKLVPVLSFHGREENLLWCPLVVSRQILRPIPRITIPPFWNFSWRLCRRRDGNDHLQCKWFDKLWIDNLFPKFWMCYESFEAVTRIWSFDMFLNFHVQSGIWKDERIISEKNWLILIGREKGKIF